MIRKLFVLTQGLVIAVGLSVLPGCGGTQTESAKNPPEAQTSDGHDHSDGEHHEGDGHDHSDGADHKHDETK